MALWGQKSEQCDVDKGGSGAWMSQPKSLTKMGDSSSFCGFLQAVNGGFL